MLKIIGICAIFCFVNTTMCKASNEKQTVIGILRVSPPFGVEIEQGFKDTFQSLSQKEGISVRFLPTKIANSESKYFGENVIMAQELLEQGADILVTIGTQASVPVWPEIKNTGIPMIFSGVTFPLEGGLIKEFDKPTGENITGISYGVTPLARLELFRNMFSDKSRFNKLGFVYDSNVLQETIYVKHLKELVDTKGWDIVYIDFYDPDQGKTSGELLLEKLQQSNPDLIFGWFSLDQLSSDEEQFKRLQNSYKKPILGITSKFTDEGAIGGVLTNHFSLGALQAKIVDKIIQGEEAGNIPPMEPVDYLIELNLKKAAELGVEFDLDIIAAADRLIQ
jgi:putative ABC transport system substrate-binding protein